MNIQQIQFNRQKVAALLLAGSILAATAGLVWADISSSQANWGAGSVEAGAEAENGEPPTREPQRH